MGSSKQGRSLLFASGGGVAGTAAQYIYINTNLLERLAAEADGFPAWSLWQLPFCLPGGIAGAVVGALFGVALESVRD